MSGSLVAALRACAAASVSLGFASPVVSQANGGALAGVVRTEDSSTPINGAIAEIRALGLRTTSDSSGAFRIGRVPAGEHRLDLRALGYTAVAVTVHIGNDTTSEVRIALIPIPLPTVDVESGLRRGDERMRGFHDRRSAGFGRFITRAEIERREVSDTKELLRGMPGVRLVGERVQMASSSSTPRCLVQYFVDAIHIVGAPFDFLRQFRPRDIEGIEVYRGPAETPPEFSRGGAQCGVVAIWTRTPGGRP
jgi:hypothetical protein